MSGILYLVGTPIGNLKDMTYRAVEVLNSVDAIACEDTRHSLILLNNYSIKKQLLACHQHNERESAEKIALMLDDNKNVALITDAGMPAISDPGAVVVDILFNRGYNIQVVPGASAVVSAMALSGICHKVWSFIGFLPSKTKDRQALLDNLKNLDSSLVFYCSPYDINKDTKFLYKALGERKVHIIKEITKMHERHEIFDLSDCEIENPKGEYVVIVEKPLVVELQKADDISLQDQINNALGAGMSKMQAIKYVAKQNGLRKDEVYKLTIHED